MSLLALNVAYRDFSTVLIIADNQNEEEVIAKPASYTITCHIITNEEAS